MNGDLDVYRPGNPRIEQHGDDAPFLSVLRAEDRFAAGDVEGNAVRLRAPRAIGALQETDLPGGGDTVSPGARRMRRDAG